MYNNYLNSFTNGYGNNYGRNPYTNPYQSQQLPQQEIIKVNGENGAQSFQMGANSSALLLDTSNPIVWLVQTDGAGYKTVTAFDIVPHQEQPQIDLSMIDARLKKVEEIINESYNEPTSETGV